MGIKVTEECQETYTTAHKESVFLDGFRLTSWNRVPAFAGYEICQSSDTTTLKVGEFRHLIILHQAILGESWLATVQDSVPIFAVVDSIRQDSFFGLADSLKYISFHANSPDSSALTSIVISQSYGLMTGTYFWDILNLPYKVDLLGLSDPAAGTQVEDGSTFFDDPGPQELHLESSFTRSIPTGYEQIVTKMQLQLEERLVLGIDHLRYTYTGRYFSFSSDYPDFENPRDSTGVRDTTFSIEIRPLLMQALNGQPGSLVPNFGLRGFSDIYFLTTLSNYRADCLGRSVRFNLPLYVNSPNIFETDGLSLYSDQFYGNTFREKIPIPFYSHGGQSDIDISRFHYVRDNGRECGTPLDFSGLTSLATNPLEAENLQVSPNPTNGQFFINDPESTPETHYQMVDLTGRKILTVEANGLSTFVNAAAIPTGTYFVLKVKAGIVVSKGRVVIQ
jgi:hypothetical protein